MATNLPQVPGYFALRVGADLASAARGDTIHFDYADGMLQVVDASAGADGGPPVAVRTAPSAQRPTVSRVRLTATAGDADLGSIVLNGATYGALVWGESAVEKFLLPYYASAGGPHAYEVMHAINHVWYDFPVEVPVVALAFAYPSRPVEGGWQLWDTLHVLHVKTPATAPGGGGAPYVVGEASELGQLAMTPLLQFVQVFQPGTATTTIPEPSPSTLPRTFVPRFGGRPTNVDSVAAREVAEYASGLRGHDVWVYDSPTRGLSATLNRLPQPTQPLFEAFTPFQRPDRPVVSVEMWDGEWHPLRGTGSSDPTQVPDSVFWTDGAVDMLMVPYYASVQGAGAPPYLEVLLRKWAGALPATTTDARDLLRYLGTELERTMCRLEGDEPASAATSEVYAIVHLPNSEWVDEIDPPPTAVTYPVYLENRTVLLTRGGGRHPLVSTRRRLVPFGRGIRG
jgi:hypothetical protein